MEAYLQRNATSDDATSMVILADIEFGKGFLSIDTIKRKIQEPTTAVLVGAFGDKVIAFAIGTLQTLTEPSSNPLPSELYSQLDSTKNNTSSSIGIIETVSVTPMLQDSGVTISLISALISKLRSLGALEIISAGWRDDETCHMEKMLAQLHFEYAGSIENYWTQDSVNRGYSCLSCAGICRCNADFFLLTHQTF